MPIIPPHGDRDMRPEVLPSTLLPMFDDSFVHSCDLIEEYTLRLAVQVFQRLGGEEAAATPATVAQMAAQCDLDLERAAVPLGWLVDVLHHHQLLEKLDEDSEPRFQLSGPLPQNDPAEIRELQEAHDPRALPSYDIAAVAADAYPACLKGEISGEQALFAPVRLALWSKYFSNDNPLYAVNNRIPALDAAGVAETAMGTATPTSILEIGGGLGSAGCALAEALQGADRTDSLESYRFTDISPVFLRRGQRALAAHLPEGVLEAGRLDIDRPFAEQRAEPESADLVFAVNTLHVAKDLGFTLHQILQTLRPGGRLVFGECVRPAPGTPIYTELVFLLLESFRGPILHPEWRPTGGFLTPGQWRAALEAAGFENIGIYPDVSKIHPHYDNFVVASLSARRPA